MPQRSAGLRVLDSSLVSGVGLLDHESRAEDLARHLPRPQARAGTKHDPCVAPGHKRYCSYSTCADLHVSAHPVDVLFPLGGRASANVVPSVSNPCAHLLAYQMLREVAGTADYPFGQTTLAPSTGQVPSS